MLPVSWSIISFLSARQKLLALAEFKNQWSQELSSTTSYSLKLLFLVRCSNSACMLLVSDPTAYNICPTLYIGIFYLGFFV